MRRLATAWAVLPALLLGAPPVRAQGESRVLDRIAAVIVTPARPDDPGVITLSRLEFETKVWVIMGTQGRTTIATATPDADDLRKTLTYVIGQRLVYDQAEMQDVNKVSANKVEERVDTFASYLGGPEQLDAFLAKQGMRYEELQNILERDLRVEQHLAESPSFETKLSPAEIDAYERANAVKLGILADPKERRDAAVEGATLEKQLHMQQAQLRQLFAHAKVRIVDRDLAGADAAYQPVTETKPAASTEGAP